MLTRRAALAVLAAVPFVVCSGCDDELAMYYPLAPGLTWRYRVLLAQNSGAAGYTAVVTNLKPVMLFGRTLVPQRSELNPTSVDWMLTMPLKSLSIIALESPAKPRSRSQ